MTTYNNSPLAQFGHDAMARVERAVTDLSQGKGVLLIDDEDRENEGDLIFAADHITPQSIATLIRECSGIICVCITQEKAKELALPMMVLENTSRFKTAFTVSIEAKEGVTTGVSASDRCRTIRTVCHADAKPDDLARPGHVFPIVAANNGVLARRGHTEGSIDLMQIAGLPPIAVLCELTNRDGTMAKTLQIIDFALQNDLMVLSVEDIYQYRMMQLKATG